MIKKIHYIWLGSDLPFKNSQIVEEWKELMPDFEYYFWNESNISQYNCLFLKQCIRKKAYAFAADYLRLRIVNDFGGFYLDTDMKILKSLSSIEVGDFMIGEVVVGRTNWGIFYSKPNSEVLGKCIEKYNNFYFDQFKPPVIPYFLNEIIFREKTAIIYPSDWFYPLPHGEDVLSYSRFITKNTVGVHLWDFSWGKIKQERKLLVEIFYRFQILVTDFCRFDYPLHYFTINLTRMKRLILAKLNR